MGMGIQGRGAFKGNIDRGGRWEDKGCGRGSVGGRPQKEINVK